VDSHGARIEQNKRQAFPLLTLKEDDLWGKKVTRGGLKVKKKDRKDKTGTYASKYLGAASHFSRVGGRSQERRGELWGENTGGRLIERGSLGLRKQIRKGDF